MSFYKNAVDMSKSRIDQVKRVVVAVKSSETEKVPEAFSEREGNFYLVEFFSQGEQRLEAVMMVMEIVMIVAVVVVEAAAAVAVAVEMIVDVAVAVVKAEDVVNVQLTMLIVLLVMIVRLQQVRQVRSS